MGIVIFLLTSFSLFGQVQQGDAFLGGNLNFNLRNDDFEREGDAIESNDETRLSLGLILGFMTSDRLAAGGVLQVDHSSRTIDNSNFGGDTFEQSSLTVSLGPFIRYYAPFNTRTGFLFDMQLLGGVGSRNETLFIGGEEVEFDLVAVNFDVLPAFYYFATPRLSLEASFGALGYRFEQASSRNNNPGPEITDSTSSANFFLSSALGIRLRYFFRKKEVSPEN